MTYFFKDAYFYQHGQFVRGDYFLSDGILFSSFEGAVSITFENVYIFPGFADVHVHLREPGFSYKETIASGSAAGARGGYVHLCAMPNLDPVPDCLSHLKEQQILIGRDALVQVHPYGALTVGEKGEKIAALEELAKDVIAFSDDGKGVQNPALMKEAMQRIAALDKVLCAHCEDESLIQGGYIHDGEYADCHGHIGIPSASEWRPIERDLALARETGCAYHVCHVSAKESVQLIREAKKQGVNVTCETAPHYLTLCDADLKEEGRFKMNPPLRSAADKQALIDGINDGTIDMIATDHAPHAAEEKAKGLKGSLMGITGLETAFAVCYTELVKTGIITLEKLIELLYENPKKRFGIGKEPVIGEKATLTVFDLSKNYTIDPTLFLSKGKATPFSGKEVFGECLLTVMEGKAVYEKYSL
ncbi:MAG: dihydroorotase [Clostridiales bacterium]|nr:dihydroorotase [Clostridiales bacterium]